MTQRLPRFPPAMAVTIDFQVSQFLARQDQAPPIPTGILGECRLG